MAAPPTLPVTTRTKDAKAKQLRKQGVLPGILYGFSVGNQTVQCEGRAFAKVFEKASESTIVDLEWEGRKIPVLIHAVETHPVTGHYLHVDFLAIDMQREVTTHIPLVTTGVSPAVKDLGGVLVFARNMVTVTCLPQHLPSSIAIDVTPLAHLRDTVRVAQIPLPAGVKILEPSTEILLTVVPPREEEVEEPKAEAAAEIAVAPGEAAAPGEGTPPAATEAAAPAKKEKEAKK